MGLPCCHGQLKLGLPSSVSRKLAIAAIAMVLQLDAELAAELAAHPELTQPPPPCPEGVSLGDYLRGISSIVVGAFGQSFVARLPSGEFWPFTTRIL